MTQLKYHRHHRVVSWMSGHPKNSGYIVSDTMHNFALPCDLLLAFKLHSRCIRAILLFFCFRKFAISAFALFLNCPSILGLYFTSEFAEIVGRADSAFLTPSSWLEVVGPWEEEGRGERGRKERDEGREDEYSQFLKRGYALP